MAFFVRVFGTLAVLISTPVSGMVLKSKLAVTDVPRQLNEITADASGSYHEKNDISLEVGSGELAQLGTFHNLSRTHTGGTVMANGPFVCQDAKVRAHSGDEVTEQRPACTGNWGYFWRAKIHSVDDYNKVNGLAPGYATRSCDNSYWFIACLDQDQFNGSTQNMLWDVQDWCLQLDAFLYRMAATKLVSPRHFTDMTLASVKHTCNNVASREAMVRLAQAEDHLIERMSETSSSFEDAKQVIIAGGARGDQGPSGDPGPVGPAGEPGTRGATAAPGGPPGPAGPPGHPGRNGTDGHVGIDGTAGNMYVPDAASCKGDYCTWTNQYCPGARPGSKGSGYCCGSSGSWEYANLGRKSCH